jgi:hypothetical protein
MKPEGSSPCSQQPTLFVLNQINPVHVFQNDILKIPFNIIFYLCLGLPSGLFPSGLPIKILYAAILSARPSCLILLDMIAGINIY